jgi:hypothetical protein
MPEEVEMLSCRSSDLARQCSFLRSENHTFEVWSCMIENLAALVNIGSQAVRGGGRIVLAEQNQCVG